MFKVIPYLWWTIHIFAYVPYFPWNTKTWIEYLVPPVYVKIVKLDPWGRGNKVDFGSLLLSLGSHGYQ